MAGMADLEQNMRATVTRTQGATNKAVCIVKGCVFVAYKHGVCRKHWNEVPIQTRISIATDAMTAAHKAAKKRDTTIAQWARTR